MADAISALASVQLGVLQAPEIARETVPLAAQAQIANAQATLVIDKHSEEMLETVQQLQRIEESVVPDALAGNPEREPPSYRQRRRRAREPVREEAIPLAAVDPRGLGAMVDLRA